ncbi:hypothetical protein [Benzoatithermus flavus]|uniref:Uncharacterized protein n=1 Tax=Benzoatithermus flavus TaxID=3108223 RepID=A0ABU8XZ37_9PROT
MIFTKKFLVAKIEEKANVNLYTLLDLDNFDKITTIGVKADVKEREVVETKIRISLKRLSFKDEKGQQIWVDVADTFLVDIRREDA